METPSETHAIGTASPDHAKTDSLPVLVNALQQYFETHKEVAEISSAVKRIGLEDNNLDHNEKILIAMELDKIRDLLAPLKKFFENDEKGRETIVNDSGLSLQSFIDRFELHVLHRETQHCFKAAGDLRAWLVVELKMRRDQPVGIGGDYESLQDMVNLFTELKRP